MKKIVSVLGLVPLLFACGDAADVQPVPQTQTTTTQEVPGPPAQELAIGGNLRLHEVQGQSLVSPLDEAWGGVEAYRVELTLAPPVHQSINLRYDPGAAPVPVTLQVASSGERVYVRLRWPDDSADRVIIASALPMPLLCSLHCSRASRPHS